MLISRMQFYGLRFVLVLTLFFTNTKSGQSQGNQKSYPYAHARQSNSGVSEKLNLERPPKPLWSLKLERTHSGAAYRGCIYLLTGPTLRALNPETGESLWETEIPAETVTGLMVAANPDFDFIAVSHDSGLTLVERHSGAVLWTTQVEMGLAGPVIFENRIYAAGNFGNAYAFDLNNGEILWEHDFVLDAPPDPPGFDGAQARFGDQPARPRPASTDGKTVYFSVFDQCRVIALDCKTGQRRWAFQTQGWMFCRPAVSAKHVLVGSQDKHVYCINKATGKKVWKYKTKSRVEAAPATDGKHVFVGSCDANLYCLDIETGEKIWQFATKKRKKYGGPIYEQALITQDIVYLPTMEGQIYAISKLKGEQHWRTRPSLDSEIDLSFTDGQRLFVGTRMNFDDEGEVSFHALGRPEE